MVRATSGPQRERMLAGTDGVAAPAVLPAGRAVDPAKAALAVVHGLDWLVANLADHAPVELLVDDAHRADAPPLRFLAYLARRLGAGGDGDRVGQDRRERC